MIVVIIVAVAAWLFSGSKNEEQIDLKQEAVTTQTLQNSVTATGTIEAVTSVTVGTQVSGIVNKLYVDYNSQVKKGEVIAELDKTNLMSELNTAKANLASAQSSLNYQSANMSRYQTLYKKGLVSADDYENALLTYRQAKEQVASAKENVQKAQTNLSYATITSPIDGTVISKSVEEGQTVAASFNTPELFTIAKDLTNMQVIANVDEADIGGVKEGDRVNFTVDAYPDDVFQGTVKQVRLEAILVHEIRLLYPWIGSVHCFPSHKHQHWEYAIIHLVHLQTRQASVIDSLTVHFYDSDETMLLGIQHVLRDVTRVPAEVLEYQKMDEILSFFF